MRQKKIIFSLFVMLFSFAICKAEEPDPDYISSFKTKLNFRLLVNQNGFKYSLRPVSSLMYSKSQLNNAQMNYASYIPLSAGFSVNFMGFGFSSNFQFTKQYFNPSGKDVTFFKDIRISILGRKICTEGFYERFNDNYYNSNPKLFSKTLVSDAGIQERHWGLSMQVITNSTKFSYKAAFAQTEFQKKSASTFLVCMGYDQNQILKSGGLLLDTTSKKYYDNLSNLYKLRQQLLFVMPGFATNLVYQKFYFATAFYVGSGAQFNNQFAGVSISKKTNLPFLTKARCALGINGKSVYTGIFANADYSRASFQSLKTESLNYKIGCFLGFRIVTEKKSKAQKKEEKLKLKRDKNKRA